MSKDVYVFIEQIDGQISNVSMELLQEARMLAEQKKQDVVAVLPGDNIKDKAIPLIWLGADSVIYIDDPILKIYTTEPYAKAVTEVLKKNNPEIVLFGATSIGRDLAPKVAARLKTGLTADCTSLEIDEETGHLLMTMPALGGDVLATIICREKTLQMATVRPGVVKAGKPDKTRKGDVTEYKVEFLPSDMNINIREIRKTEKNKEDISEADVVVAGGSGIGGPEHFTTLKLLADELGGVVASTRPNVDAGWISEDKQVGQTGKTVRPKLYMALGISGAIQHVTGMENSEYVIAINKDPDARIFDIADFGIVGDMNEIIPILIRKIKSYKEEKPLHNS